jgi:hypothetical protein
MAYTKTQLNVGTPRFYINWAEYYLNTYSNAESPSVYAADSSLWRLNPVHTRFTGNGSTNVYHLSFQGVGGEGYNFITGNMAKGINFGAVFGHNLHADVTSFRFGYNYYTDDEQGWGGTTLVSTNTINGGNNNTYIHPRFDGFSIAIYPEATEGRTYQVNCSLDPADAAGTDAMWGSISCVIWGKYYDMPHSPNMELSKSYSYGIDKTTTHGGSTLTNANWIKPPKWGNMDAWQLSGQPSVITGRRTWNLKFSYMTDTKTFPYNLTGLSDATSAGFSGDDNFLEHVLLYTNGGQLPFIFCPDPSIAYTEDNGVVTSIPEFAICRLDMDSFEFNQVANNVYDISLKIVESW